jgi:uncharacterized protein involved in exopolysaccharide biosynthesis
VTRFPDAPAESPSPPPAPDPGDLFDYELLRDWARFVWTAPRRHWLLTLLCFATVVGGTFAALAVLPRRWEVQARILTQRNPLEQGIDREDAPTRAARELILRRDNVVSLLKQTNFIERHLESRAPAARARAWVVALLRGREPTPDELREGLADAVEDRLWALPGADGTVDIGFRWSDRELTFDVVEAAVQSFLEVRHAAEVSSIDESIAIYEEHAVRLAHEIAAKTKAVEALERELRASAPRRRPPMIARPVRDEEGAKLEARLAARRRTLADVEEYRQRRLTELQAQLLQQETMYADQHPVVVGTRRSIEALSGPSPQASALRTEVTELEREIARRGTRPNDPTRETPSPMATADEPPLRLEAEDPRLEQERHQLWMLVRQHSGLLERIDDARVQIDTARAGFKYRYMVVTPPQLPKAPIAPKVPLIAVSGVIAGVMLAFLAGVAADVRRGLIVQRWQVERSLGIRVLAEIDEK